MLTTGQPCQSAMPKPSSVIQQAQREPLLLSLFLFLFGRKAHRPTFCDVHVSGKDTSSPPSTVRLSLFFFFILPAILCCCLLKDESSHHFQVRKWFSVVASTGKEGNCRKHWKFLPWLWLHVFYYSSQISVFLCNKKLGKNK